jgi:cytidyltransferase-like protein
MKNIKFRLVAIAGTFDRLHKGHEYFIFQAFKIGEKVLVGLTSDEYAKNKLSINNSQLSVNSYEKRKIELTKFLNNNKLADRATIEKIHDVYGSAGTIEILDAILVTKETVKGVGLVNIQRRKNKLKPVKVITVPYVFADDHRKISSTRIRMGEIDRWGKVFERNLRFSKEIPGTLRLGLKEPLGVLIKGDSDNLLDVAEELNKAVVSSNSILISTIGDEVTKLANQIGLTINLAIVDFRVNRIPKYTSLKDHGFTSEGSTVSEIDNPPGCITKSLVSAIEKAYSNILHTKKTSIIRVVGEEDLAGLPAILLAPLGALVIYGQPGEGIVLVEVTEEKKEEILKLMEKYK